MSVTVIITVCYTCSFVQPFPSATNTQSTKVVCLSLHLGGKLSLLSPFTPTGGMAPWGGLAVWRLWVVSLYSCNMGMEKSMGTWGGATGCDGRGQQQHIPSGSDFSTWAGMQLRFSNVLLLLFFHSHPCFTLTKILWKRVSAQVDKAPEGKDIRLFYWIWNQRVHWG